MRTGLDRLLGSDSLRSRLLRGRLGFLTHPAAVTRDMTHAVTALRARGHAFEILFGPEHGYGGDAQDMATVADARDAHGTLVRSLYGDRFEDLIPKDEDLARIDTLLVDLQDVGSRYYTFVWTAVCALRACAKRGVRVVVLDRPNPIGGTHVDGFVADSAARYGFGSFASIPVVHGLTIGELARYYEGEHLLRGGVRPRLTVVSMKGWHRTMWWDQTGLPWRKPSPNLPSLEATLAYAGTCLFEATNLSEGRGSDAPFQDIGAPWLDNARATTLLNALGLPGVAFEAVTFTPEKKPFHGRAPRFAGQALPGIHLRITDRESFEPVRAGIALLWAIHELHPDRLTFNDDAFARLAGTARLKAMIIAGKRPAEIFAAWAPEVEAFRARSARYYLYDLNGNSH